MADALVLLPNVPALVVAFLRFQDEVAAIAGQRVVTELGKSQEWPAVRVTQFNDAPTIQRPLVHTRTDLQLDCFGGPKSLAWQLAETCRAALVARFRLYQSYDVGTHVVSGIVTGCAVSGLRDLPDAEFTPAKPRFMFSATVWSRASRLDDHPDSQAFVLLESGTSDVG